MKKTYRLDIGNSTIGSVGAVLRVEASSAQEALELFKDFAPEFIENQYTGLTIRVYFNDRNFSLSDVWEDD